jgi:general secretion pathway protein F
MPYFRYKAVNAAGEIVEGEMEGLDRLFVISRLQDDGCMPVRADEIDGKSDQARSRWRPGHGKLAIGDLALMSHELGTLLRAGLSMDRALTVLAPLAAKPINRVFVARILDKVRSGTTLSEALDQQSDVLPSYYVGMVRAGEASNNLGPIFVRLAQLLNRTKTVRDKVRSALLYPAIVLVVAFFTIAILVTVVVPQFRPMFEDAGVALPWSTEMIVALGDLLRSHWWALLAAVAALGAGVRQHYRQAAGRIFWDRTFLKLPIIGTLILKLEVARFARTLGTLLENGIAELTALEIATSTVTNHAVANGLSNVGARLRRGDGWSVPLREIEAFPELAVQLIQVGEESGQLDAMLIQTADIFDEDAQRLLERLLTLLVPVITIVLGLIVAAIIGSMLTAILSTYNLPV